MLVQLMGVCACIYALYPLYIYAKECFEIDWQQRQIQRAMGNYLDGLCLIQALVLDQVIINSSCLFLPIRQPDSSKGTTRKKEKREKQKPKKDEEEEEDGGGWEEVKGGAAAHSAKGVSLEARTSKKMYLIQGTSP